MKQIVIIILIALGTYLMTTKKTETVKTETIIPEQIEDFEPSTEQKIIIEHETKILDSLVNNVEKNVKYLKYNK